MRFLRCFLLSLLVHIPCVAVAQTTSNGYSGASGCVADKSAAVALVCNAVTRQWTTTDGPCSQGACPLPSQLTYRVFCAAAAGDAASVGLQATVHHPSYSWIKEGFLTYVEVPLPRCELGGLTATEQQQVADLYSLFLLFLAATAAIYAFKVFVIRPLWSNT